jgi:hypothetical protein
MADPVVLGAELKNAVERAADGPVFYPDPDFVLAWSRVAAKVHDLSERQGLWSKQGRSYGRLVTMIALCHSELSEALECMRVGDPPDKNVSEMSGVEVQLSDALGILMDISAGFGFDLAGALLKKMEFNKGRGDMHGGKLF